MPTPRKVNGNSKGGGVSKALFFEGKYDSKTEFPEGWGGGVKLKDFLQEGYGYFLKQHIERYLITILTKSCNKVKCPISTGRELSLLLLKFKTCKGKEQSSEGKVVIWFRLQADNTMISLTFD